MRLTVILLGVLLLAITSALAYSVRPQPETVSAGPSRLPFTDYAPPVPDLQALARMKAPEPKVAIAPAKSKSPVESSWHGHPCGIDLPPCYVLRRESAGDVHAVNLRGCSGHGCYGKWQYDSVTWNGYAGYREASDAPESVQDERARRDWNHGRGCAAWSACR